MDEKTKKLNEMTEELVNELLSAGTDTFLEMKLVMMACFVKSDFADRYLHNIFSFAENRRPLLICMKEGTTV